jgi:hypothetical protein
MEPQRLLMVAKLNSKIHLLNKFFFYSAVSSTFGFEVNKKCLWQQKNFVKNFILGIGLSKNAEILADSKSIEKVSSKFTQSY